MTGPLWLPAAALGLDALLGDPAALPHPVRLFGRIIARADARLPGRHGTPRAQLAAGAALALALPLAALAVSWGLIALCARVHPALGLALNLWWGGRCLAARDLLHESGRVARHLGQGDLPAARRQVARIVGRDTDGLDEAAVCRAAVETVAENLGDGVVAPLVYFALGGAPLALAYKAVSTLDSMVGYRREQYLYFGRASARLDDVLNFLPARLSALMLCLAAALLPGYSGRGALSVWRRDRRRHPSPNSAQGEAAMAGALGIFLGGPSRYRGRLSQKPVLGAGGRGATWRDIRRANRLTAAASALALLAVTAARAAIGAML